jgi:hypothetical protein
MNICSQYNQPLVAYVINRSKDPSEGRLSIFNAETKIRLRDFPVIYSRAGLKRCAPGRDMKSCFVGCYQDHGLAAYSTEDGSELWRRADILPLQNVASFPLEDIVFCQSQDLEALILCSSTGHTLDIQHGLKDVHSSPFCKVAVVGARKLEVHQPFGTVRGRIDRTTFAVLDCAFSENEIVITESGGPLRCFALDSIEPMWTHTPRKGTHFLTLSFFKGLDSFVGILWDFEEGDGGAGQRLLHLDRQTGAVIRDMPLDITGHCHFCLAGSLVFTSHLQLLSAETGSLVHQFDEETNDHHTA